MLAFVEGREYTAYRSMTAPWWGYLSSYSKLSERFVVAMKDDIILAEVDGEGMIIDVEKGTSHFLNETALLLFKMMKEGNSIDEIKEVMLKEYDVDEADVEKDIREFISKLEKKAVLWERKNT